MSACKTCGSRIDELDGLKLCPACALAGALLDKDPEPAPAMDASKPERAFPPLIQRLPIRENFFDKYQILECIGRGGQGRVWKVLDLEFRRILAMKGLNEAMAGNASACYRFLAEAQIASQLKHPGILPIYDVGLDADGRPFYTTELSSGTDLRAAWSRLKGSHWNKQKLNRALELIVRACEIMAHAHFRGVLHRDLKPANILVGEFGEVRIIDWGSATVLKHRPDGLEEPFVRLEEETPQTDRADLKAAHPEYATGYGGLPTTLIYCPPELVAGRKAAPFGPETDIYSMGVILYEMLAGHPPFSDGHGKLPDMQTLEQLIAQQSPPPLRKVAPHQSRDLEAITRKAMAFNKKDRYRSMLDLAADLRASVELRPIKARGAGPVLRVQRLVRRNPSPSVLLGVIIFILAVGYSVIRGVDADRRAERQLHAMAAAEADEQHGHWRDALTNLDWAESEGYGDKIDLNLQRAEAFTVLNQADRARAALSKLINRPDLGGRRGLVLLRMGEHEMFDGPQSGQGVKHIIDALAAGLGPADENFAKGLLATSTPDALELFGQALAQDPYHHSAHVHTLGLDYVMGLHDRLEVEMQIFEAHYPEDPSPRFLEAMEMALKGQLAESRHRVALLTNAANPELLHRLDAACQQMAAMAAFFDPQRVASSPQTNLALMIAGAGPLFRGGFVPNFNEGRDPVRMPELPCVRQGLLDGFIAVRGLVMPQLGSPRVAAAKVEMAWKHHPEGLMPAIAGMLLDRYQPFTNPAVKGLQATQAELFQLAADSPSILPKLPMLARYLAARSQFQLAERNDADAASACIANIRRAYFTRNCSTAELGAYFDYAFALRDYDLARELLDQWESVAPASVTLRRKSVELELAVGALESARKQIEGLLRLSSTDQWALEARARLVQQIKALNQSDTFNPANKVEDNIFRLSE